MSAREQALCTHCSLPVPKGLLESGRPQQFCCNGCKTVWQAIHQGGLDAYYQLRELPEQPAQYSGRGFEEFDHPDWVEQHVQPLSSGIKQVELQLQGVHCAACVWLIEKLPKLLPGVRSARVNFAKARLGVEYASEEIALSQIAKCLDSLGYQPFPATGLKAEQARASEQRQQLTRIAIAGALAGNVMAIAFALYGGLLHGMSANWQQFFRWSAMLLTTLSIAWPGRIFFQGAWAALRTRTSHMDLPIALGLAAGYLGGVWHTFNDAGEVYFESVCILIFLLLVGRYVQQKQQRSAWSAVELLHSLIPGSARRLIDHDQVDAVPISALRANDLVEVRAGESVPADGIIKQGASDFDLSLLNGESRPESLAVGAEVYAGNVNLSSKVVVQVTQTGEATRAGRLMNLVERHAQLKAPVVKLADRISSWFVVVVLLLSALCFSLWWSQDSARALEHTIALLIVACPCALGLATPLAVAASVGKAAKQGILIKGGEALERVARPGIIWLDKTGTLTSANLSVVEVWGDKSALNLAAAVEANSAHIYARTICDFHQSNLGATNVIETPGQGISGVVAGQEIKIGSGHYLAAEMNTLAETWIAAAIKRALTPILISIDGEITALLGLGDAVHQDAKNCLASLRDDGWQLGVLSGDHQGIVDAIAEQLELAPEHCHGQVSPEQKLQVINNSLATADGKVVVMVGDGVNDAAALAAADIGIAVQGGAEASLAAADVFLARAGSAPLVEFIHGAARTMRIIRRGLLVSLSYNAFVVALAFAGLLNPLWAAVLMPVSSLSVVSLAWRSRSY